jgi:hypothetical protein
MIFTLSRLHLRHRSMNRLKAPRQAQPKQLVWKIRFSYEILLHVVTDFTRSAAELWPFELMLFPLWNSGKETSERFCAYGYPAGPNARVQRRRPEPKRGQDACCQTRTMNMITENSFPVLIHAKTTASGMTTRGAGAVRCNEWFAGAGVTHIGRFFLECEKAE